jgi:hypothetical protein
VASPVHRSALSLVALTTAGALVLSGCTSDSGGSKSAATSSAAASSSPSPSSAVTVPDGIELTDQGATLSFGEPANVILESGSRGTILRLTVRSVRQGSLADFRGFILDDAYKRRASYYYADVTVRNVGTGVVGRVAVPVWGVNAANTLLPAVNFTTPFPTCTSRALPARLPPGASLNTCLVYLSPNKGALTSVSYRPNQKFNPIIWTGHIAKPAPLRKPAKKPAEKPAEKKPAEKPAEKKPAEKNG